MVTIFNFQFLIFNKLFHSTFKRSDPCFKAGYTLLELVISIGIIVTITAATLPGLTVQKNVNQLNDFALSFQSKLKQAQSYALSPPVDNQGAVAYGVEVTDDGTQTASSTVRLRSGVSEKYPSNNRSAVSSVKIISTLPIDTTVVWYKIGTTVKIETTPASSGNVAFVFGLRNGDTSEIRTVSVDSITGAINAK